MKKLTLIATLIGTLSLTGCSDANIASHNLSKASDNFEVPRRIVFYNGITNDYMLEIEGLCSIGKMESAKGIIVICKVQYGYKKHFLGLSDNVTFFAEQINPKKVGVHHYRVTFKPQTIIPDVDFRGSVDELTDFGDK